MKGKRNDNNRVEVKLSDDDYAVLLDKLEQSGLSKKEFIRRSINNTIILDLDGFKHFNIALKHLSNNVNQAVRYFHSGTAEYETIINFLSDINELRQLLLPFLNRMKKKVRE